MEFLLKGHGAVRVKNGLGEIAEYAGFLESEATLDHGAIDGAKNAVDVASGSEFASGLEEIGGERGVVLRGGRAHFGSYRLG